MTLSDKLKGLSARVEDTLPHLQTEEATKNALVMPFLGALGYDVFNPMEVVPEFTADVGTKRGEKVDYAVMRDGNVIILVEAKKAHQDLNEVHSSQLYRYFSVTSARIAILTNGVVYRFFSDLEEPNKMDQKAFLEVDLRDLKDGLLSELSKLSRDAFDLDNMLTAASDLKYMREIRRVLEEDLDEPSEELVKYFFAKANPTGRFVQSAREQFTRLVKKTLSQAISERVSARLRSAIEHESATSKNEALVPDTDDAVGDESGAEERDGGIETTEEELHGFRIVKAIVCSVLPPDRIHYRDTKSYFGVLVDDNNRRPICRLHFNRSQKYIGLFDEDKKETRHALDNLESIYTFAPQLRQSATRYLEQSTDSSVASEPVQ